MINAFKNLGLISQLALSVLTPCFITIALCTWLKNYFGLGNWVIVAGIIWGIASGFVSVYRYMQKAMADAEKQQREYDSQFR